MLKVGYQKVNDAKIENLIQKKICDKPNNAWKPIGFRSTIQELEALTFISGVHIMTTNDVDCELVKKNETLL